MIISTSILPSKQTFARKLNVQHELDFEAICVFLATGFFMGEDTYWKDEICLLPGHKHELNDRNALINSTSTFKWHYNPQQRSFDEALEEYISLLTNIIKNQVGDSPVILPLSGGLDSRSQAAVLRNMDNDVHAYSYSFEGGYPEHKIAEKIADVCGFDFHAYQIPKGYLWDSIDELAIINRCNSEFTHPRQMAILPQLKTMQGMFSLGHWGDVLFDRGAPEGTKEGDIVSMLFKKMIKPKGLELGEKLWKTWDLDGNLKSYLIGRIESDLNEIKIDDLSAKVRAYKTCQWAHRWTTTNLSIFEAAHPITLPYYDDRMCEFICTMPEDYLADRKLQLAHLLQDKSLSRITWHENKPFNLLNYKLNKSPYNIPIRLVNKLKREFNSYLGKPFIQRNWELQFLGKNNDKELKMRLFDVGFNSFVPNEIVNETYDNFLYKDAINYAHPLSMLLTLSTWHKKNQS